MKNIFRFAAIAVVAMGLTVACKSKPAETTEENTPIEQIVDDTTDTIEQLAENLEEAVDQPVKTVKAATEKAKEAVEEVKNTASTVTSDNVNTTVSTSGRKKANTETKTEEEVQASTVNANNVNTGMTTSGRKRK